MIKRLLRVFTTALILGLMAIALLPITVSAVASVTTNTFGGYGSDWAILRGVVGSGSVTQIGFDYGLTTSYGTSTTTTISLTAGQSFTATIRNLTVATMYHYRAKVYDGSWWYGSDACVSTSGSVVMYENNTLSSGNGDSQHIYGENIVAEQFTVGAVSHTITQISIRVKRYGSPTGDFYVDLYHADISGNPTGNPITSGSYNAAYLSTGYTWWGIPVDEDSLTALQPYAIVVSFPTGDASNYILWQHISTGDGDADTLGLYSTDGMASWSSGTPDYLFQIWGDACIRIVSAMVVTDYKATGDMLFAFEYINIYPPYYTYYNGYIPSQYFSIQLYDTDGVTLLSTSPMKQWGDRPVGIYLNASQASSLTAGSAYYVAVYGIFSGHPTAMYQLQPEDWGGDIEGWIISTAHNMASYYGVSFTTYLPNGDEVLAGYQNEGISMFANGIPYIMDTHPDVFQTIAVSPHYSIQPPHTEVNPSTWQQILGSTISGILNSLGTMFGINGKYIGMAFVGIIYLVYIMLTTQRGANALTASAMGFPVIAAGLYCLVVDFSIIGTIMAVAALIMLIGFWLTRT